MKPIHLALSGLQSYREKQEVDFSQLSDAGVFGIFGPTGSGKSTILDAMTLALYGRVERAPNGTQGILNQMENAAYVSFTFELSGAGATERYRVERQYKRTGDVAVNQSLSRLIRLDQGEPEVLADKAKEVDSRIQEILGLSMADFTRAVVLPQGKFAEFLALKGVERRSMLERLFHLEQYGDVLGAKVTQRLREADGARKRAEAEQLGLGDASEAAVELASERLKEQEQRFLVQRELLEAAVRETEELRRVWKLTLEEQRLEAAANLLSERLPAVERSRSELQRSAQAARIAPLLQEWTLSEAAMQEAKRAYRQAQLNTSACSAAHEAQERVFYGAQQQLEQEQEPLQQRMERLRRAQELYRELEVVGEKWKALSAKSSTLEAQLKEAELAAAKEQQQLQRAQALQLELREQLQQLELPAVRREELQAAVMAAKEEEHLLQQCKELAVERQTLEGGRMPLKLKSDRLAAKHAELDFQQQELLRQYEELNGMLSRSLERSRQLTAACRTAEAMDRQREQERYRLALASNLASELTEGQPCPVCGSSHHPQLAQASHESTAAVTTSASWEELVELGIELSAQLERLGSQLHGEGSRTIVPFSQQQLDASSSMPLAELEAAPAAEAASFSGGEANELSNRRAADLAEELQIAAEALDFELKRWVRGAREWEAEHKQLREQQSAVDVQASTLAAAVQSAQEKLSAANARHARWQEAWLQRYPGWTPEEARSDWEAAQNLIRQQEDLRSRLDKAEPYLAEQLKRVAAARDETYRLERELVQATTELAGLGELVTEKRSRLTAELHSELSREAVERELSEAAARLQELRSHVQASQQELTRLQAEFVRASNLLAAAEQAAQLTEEGCRRAEETGRRELLAAGFEGLEEAQGAKLEPTVQRQLEEQVAGFEEEVAHNRSRLKQVKEALQDASATEEQWQAGEARLAELRRQDEAALQDRAKAERDLEELMRKHERWLELELERTEADQLANRLQKLQQVLKGNAFVEFMAEEQLLGVSRAASERLGQLTRRRYALETDSTGGFVIRDDANGGLRRPVSTLSGGETFLTSLSLALALSAQIQLNGKYPLEFFFLDEGFGTLDPELLETVVHALEKLHLEKLTVGVISHVPELKSRLPRRLVVTPAEASGAGSRIRFEQL